MDERTVTVAVHDQVLWIGSEAFPVRNITRAGTEVVVRPRSAAVGSFVLFAIGSTVVAVILAAVLGGTFGSRSTDSGPLAVMALLLVVLLIRLVGLIRFVAGPDLYRLVLETSGRSSARVLSRDRAPVDRVVREVMAAINDPSASGTFHLNVVNEGDRINVGGTYNELRGSHHRVGG